MRGGNIMAGEDYSSPYDFSSLGEDATTIFKVRVLQGLPLYVLGNTHRRSSHYFHEPKRILGEVPVESDGSFRVRIPTEIPIHFQTLDKNDRVISTMRSWVYLNPTHPNMQTRVCIGCHEKRGYTTPTGASLAIAAQKEATDLTAEADKPISQSHMHHFVRDVYPIIRKYCLPCHDNKNENGTYKAPDGNLDLSDDVSPIYNVAYDSLKPWLMTDNAIRRSELLRMLTRARKVNGCGMPLAPEEEHKRSGFCVATIPRWIEFYADGRRRVEHTCRMDRNRFLIPLLWRWPSAISLAGYVRQSLQKQRQTGHTQQWLQCRVSWKL